MRWNLAVLATGCALFTLTSCTDAPSDTSGDSAGGEASTVQRSTDASQTHKSGSGHDGQSDGGSQTVAHAKRSDARHSADAGPAGGHGHGQHASVEGHEAHDQRRGHGDGHVNSGSRGPKITIGEKVPDFEVTFNGRTWKLSELQKNAEITPDGTLVLTFWCSFCHSCRDVELALNRLAEQFRGKAGVIALDASFGESAEDVAAFASERGLTLPIALNASGSAADVFGVSRTTTTVVIDGEGTLRYIGQFGGRGHNYAEDALKSVLAGEDVSVQSTPPRG